VKLSLISMNLRRAMKLKLEYKMARDYMIGTCMGAGTIDLLPAIILSYHGGADAWVFWDGMWLRVRKVEYVEDALELLDEYETTGFS